MDVAAEEAIVVVNKGKRTKRQRPCSPASAMNLLSANNNSNNNNNVCEYLSSSSWSSGEEGEDHDHDPRCFPSPVATTASTDSTEEEEDMANCLILLAQGTQGCPRRRIIDDDYRINPSKRLNIGVGDDDGMVNNCNNKLGNRKVVGGGGGSGEGKNNNGFYLYKCKTCNRCFPSFQALGGHRASHKKPRTSPVAVAVVEDKKSLLLDEDRRENQFTTRNLSTTTTTTTTTTIPSLGLALHLGNRISSPNNNNNNNNNKAKVHECSVCGSEFSSGQALGGHMRRHRPSIAATGNNGSNVDSITSESDQEVRIKKERNVLTLDLNLPAPEDDKFSFNSKQVQQQQQPPPLVFSAPALVDCHY
ncbi:hypothetical protein Scep_015417 [Stephania cephalantha]|uniref:C2H2-type domain-containing protein n=1 Tax=Stephania cephalantha TaxID=152367 RepID=A0AAP0J5M5_9MAGN